MTTTVIETLTYYQWRKRYLDRIVSRLTVQGSEWTAKQAEEAAWSEFEGSGFDVIYEGYENDPEASADESLSYWGDGT